MIITSLLTVYPLWFISSKSSNGFLLHPSSFGLILGLSFIPLFILQNLYPGFHKYINNTFLNSLTMIMLFISPLFSYCNNLSNGLIILFLSILMSFTVLLFYSLIIYHFI